MTLHTKIVRLEKKASKFEIENARLKERLARLVSENKRLTAVTQKLKTTYGLPTSKHVRVATSSPKAISPKAIGPKASMLLLKARHAEVNESTELRNGVKDLKLFIAETWMRNDYTTKAFMSERMEIRKRFIELGFRCISNEIGRLSYACEEPKLAFLGDAIKDLVYTTGHNNIKKYLENLKFGYKNSTKYNKIPAPKPCASNEPQITLAI